MQQDHVLSRLRADREAIGRFGVATLYLFGSRARNEASSGSDVDLLVEFEGPPSFDRYMDLKIHLKDLLAAPVDLITVGGLRADLAARIRREAVRVA